jgi:DNA-directed RNA polymerase specialized sigma24 family protein
MIMQLHYVEKQSYRKMSGSLGKPVNTVKSLVHRGNAMLLDREEMIQQRMLS